MKRLFSRCFFALDVDKAIDLAFSSCHTYESVKSISKHFQPQSSVEAPRFINISFAADVARRHQQLILVLREIFSTSTLYSPSSKVRNMRISATPLLTYVPSCVPDTMAAPQSVMILLLVFVHLQPTQSSSPTASAGSRMQTRILLRNVPLRSSV